MKGLIRKIIAACLGLTMALGTGFSIAARSKEPTPVYAADATTTYTFTSKAWADSTSSWTSTKDGGQLTTGQGVQVTTTYSGAGATSKNSFSNITGITFTYCTNKSAGVGSISVTIGLNTATTYSVTKTGGTTARTTSQTYATPQSGQVSFTVTCTTNSIYIASITINYEKDSGGGDTPVSSTYTLDGTDATQGTNGYATESDVTQNDIAWKVMGNTTMNPWRIGGKSLDSVDRTIYSVTAISEEIYQIDIVHGSATDITVNSWTVIVASDAEFTNVISTLTPTFTASNTTTINRPAGKSWKNAYYRFIYNVTVTATDKNKFLEFTGATFYYEQISENAEAWCASFLSTVTCDAAGATPPSTSAWSTMKTSFLALDSADQLALKTAYTEATVRYDYIIAKYGTTNYENFIGRAITPLLSSRVLFNSAFNENSIIPIIVIIALTSLTALMAYAVIRKKKEN